MNETNISCSWTAAKNHSCPHTRETVLGGFRKLLSGYKIPCKVLKVFGSNATKNYLQVYWESVCTHCICQNNVLCCMCQCCYMAGKEIWNKFCSKFWKLLINAFCYLQDIMHRLYSSTTSENVREFRHFYRIKYKFYTFHLHKWFKSHVMLLLLESNKTAASPQMRGDLIHIDSKINVYHLESTAISRSYSPRLNTA